MMARNKCSHLKGSASGNAHLEVKQKFNLFSKKLFLYRKNDIDVWKESWFENFLTTFFIKRVWWVKTDPFAVMYWFWWNSHWQHLICWDLEQKLHEIQEGQRCTTDLAIAGWKDFHPRHKILPFALIIIHILYEYSDHQTYLLTDRFSKPPQQTNSLPLKSK